jgi:hypothetical protein
MYILLIHITLGRSVMKLMNGIKFGGIVLTIVLLASACGGSSGGGGGGGGTGATLTGTVQEFTAALETEKKTLFARIKDFLLPKSFAAVGGVTVSIGNQSTTTDGSGSFTLNDIPVGDQTVTFTQNSASATYSLMDVLAGETFTLNNVDVDGSTVSTAHTGTWTGTMTMDIFTGTPQEVDFTLTITAGGNSISGGMNVDEDGLGEVGTFSGTENGTTLNARWVIPHDGEGCRLAGPLTGTFDGDTLTGNEPIDESSCGLEPGDDDPDSHPFTLTKQ